MEEPKSKAMDGYILAKREMEQAIENRIAKFEQMQQKCLEGFLPGNYHQYESAKMALSELRSFVRNVMLWDHKND